MNKELEETKGKLGKLGDDVAALFAAHPDRDFTEDQVAEIRRKNAEMTDLGKKRDELLEIEAAGQRAEHERQLARQPRTRPQFPGGETSIEVAAKTFHEFLTGNQAYQRFLAGESKTAVMELDDYHYKTLMTLTTINNPATRLPQIVGTALEERTVADLMLEGSTDNNTLTYMEETTFTNAAAEVAEGVAKAESALAFTERTENVRPTSGPEST